MNRPTLFTPNYKRFLVNKIRESVPYSEVPIKLLVKERRRARPEDLIAGERERLREEGAAVVGTDEGVQEMMRSGKAEDFFDDEDGGGGDIPADAVSILDDEEGMDVEE